ncbi:MAG: ABC transporter ATP-binding protein [Lachnospiraceae bacterium]|nr:ABC transporter ATP-binding protein [Lachnospiraceae bacterium]
MATALKINNITKKYGTKTVLNNISFKTNTGEVFGLLGPNGAGKTTLIKLITGLIKIEEGEIEILGSSLNKNFVAAMTNLGAIVENPEMYKYMTGRQNIMQYVRMRKNITPERIEEVISMVGLSNRIDEKVGKYSLGMRQRLGLALSLLHNPKLLILDEPTNGLDPAGIKKLRDILTEIAHKNDVCIMVSSHLMSEMEMMCDRVAIINQGNLLMVDTIENIINLSSSNTVSYSYKTNNLEKTKELIETDETITVSLNANDVIATFNLTDNHLEKIASITANLVKNNISVYTVTKLEQQNLEEAFISITQNGGDQIA